MLIIELVPRYLEPAAIFNVRNSLSIAFLAISDRYGTFFVVELFDKANGHFGWVDNVNYRTRPIYLEPAAVLDVRNSLSIGFLALSNRYAAFVLLKCLTKWPPAAILDGTTM